MFEQLYLGWPQIAYLMLACLGLGVELSRHGKPKEGKYNFGLPLFVWGFILLPLLYCGGFFTK